MGMIIIPWLLFLLLIVVASLVLSIVFITKKAIDVKQVVFGFCLTAVIYLLIVLSYRSQESIYAFNPFFRFGTFMIFLPFIVAMVLRLFKNKKAKIVSNIILISIVISAISFVIFNSYFMEIADKLGVEKHY